MAWFGMLRQPANEAYRYDLLNRVRPEDLYQPPPQPTFPEPPQYPKSFEELDEQYQAEARRASFVAMANAIGRGASDMGNLSAYMGEANQQAGVARQQAMAQARQRVDEEHAYNQQKAAFEQQQEAQRISQEAQSEQASALVGMYQKIVDADPELAPQAEIAVRQKDMSGLSSLFEEIPRRQKFREAGLDANDPFAAEKFKAQLEAQQQAAQQRAEQAQWEERQRMEIENRIAQEKALQQNQLGPYYQAPMERQRLEQDPSRSWKPSLVPSEGKWYMVDYATRDAQGRPAMIDTGRKVDPNYRFMSDPFTGTTYIDENNPQAGAQPVPNTGLLQGGGSLEDARRQRQQERKTPPPSVITKPEAAPGNGRTSQPKPPSQQGKARPNPLLPGDVRVKGQADQVDKALGGLPPAARVQVEKDLRAGKSVAQILKEIREAQAAAGIR